MPGAGLYEVGPGKPYSTIQSALNQLYTDQGSDPFTQPQIIRIYSGTYAERVTPNPALSPTSECPLIIEAAEGESVTIDGEASHACIYATGIERFIVRRLTLTNGGGSDVYRFGMWNSVEMYDCVFPPLQTTNDGFVAASWSYFENCVFDNWNGAVGDAYRGMRGGANHFKACIFKNNKFGHYCSQAGLWCRYEACVFYLGSYGHYGIVFWNIDPYYSCTEILNCLFYATPGSSPVPIWSRTDTSPSSRQAVKSRVIIRNCLFVNNSWFCLIGGESASGTTIFDSDYNCFYNCSKIARLDGVEYATLSAWQAAGYDLHSFIADPKLVDPANGDYSLEEDSPCRRRGAGSGVAQGINGVPFDPFHPDIGAWSGGEYSAPSRPSVCVVSAGPSGIAVDIDGDEHAEHIVELFASGGAAPLASASRVGSGTVVLEAPGPSGRYFLVGWGVDPVGRSYPSAPVAVYLGGGGPFEDVRLWILGRLSEHAGLAELLGCDETGAMPIYASGTPAARRIPCIVYTLDGRPEAALGVSGRWLMRLSLELRCGSTAANDRAASAAEEALEACPHELGAWTVKAVIPQGGETSFEDGGRVELRRMSWSLVVDGGS